MIKNELVGEGGKKRKKRNSGFREQHACVKGWRGKSLAHLRVVRSSMWKESRV